MATDIVLYVTPMCGPCEQVKSYLTALGVEFDVIDVMMDEEAGELLDSKGIRSAPALRVGEEIVAGASLVPDRIDALLGIG
ncbi:MAG: glutaredoxin family protein [Pseudomonadota bacterium]